MHGPGPLLGGNRLISSMMQQNFCRTWRMSYPQTRSKPIGNLVYSPTQHPMCRWLQGNLWPLLLPSAASEGQHSQPSLISLQKLVIVWRNQAAKHALITQPDIVCLRINRFDSQGNKVRSQIVISPAVYLPVFTGADEQTASTRYETCAVVYHLGETSQSGHYRTGLYSNGSLAHVTDDNLPAQLASAQDQAVIQDNAYLVFLKRCSV